MLCGAYNYFILNRFSRKKDIKYIFFNQKMFFCRRSLLFYFAKKLPSFNPSGKELVARLIGRPPPFGRSLTINPPPKFFASVPIGTSTQILCARKKATLGGGRVRRNFFPREAGDFSLRVEGEKNLLIFLPSKEFGRTNSFPTAKNLVPSKV